MNVAAHLAAQARAGEILVTTEAAGAAGLESTGLERRSLSLKGHPPELDGPLGPWVLPRALTQLLVPGTSQPAYRFLPG